MPIEFEGMKGTTYFIRTI